jgi:hypothetical protein
MGCCSGTSKDQILQIGGEQVRLKGVTETFQYVHSMLGLLPTTPGIGDTLVKAVRQAGNDIPVVHEQEYVQLLSGMFELYCATKVRGGGCCC